MASLLRRSPVGQKRPFSSEFAPGGNEPSMLFSILPSAVQSRIPRLPSLRRSVNTSMYGLASKRKAAELESRNGLESHTPPPAYTSTSTVALARSEGMDTATEDESMSCITDTVRPDGYALLVGSSSTFGDKTGAMEINETRSGVLWKSANQGMALLGLSVEEASAVTQEGSLANPNFPRQLYIHALTYLLRALPPNLSAEEQLTVRNSLPQGIVEPLPLNYNDDYITPSPGHDIHSPSFLHRILASGIVQLFVFFHFIFPYIKYFLQAAYKYDREHKITERIFYRGIVTVDTFGKQGAGMADAIYGIGDGKVGQLIANATAWVVDGVTGGIHEGVVQGIMVMGATSPYGIERSRVT